MALEQLEMITGLNKVDLAIKVLKDNEPVDGYYLAFSGGKDSVVIKDIAIKSGVQFDSHYCVSPIDPPQIYRFIKEYHPDVQWDYHAKGFWKLVQKNGLPMRTARWCCKYIKEAGGIGRSIIVGNRRAESGLRRNQGYVEKGRNVDKIYIRPIIDFNNYDVWQYIRENNLDYCELYDEGFERVGCVLCPFNADSETQIQKYPKIAKLWLQACDKLIAKGSWYKRHNFKTGQELFEWWISRK